MKHELTLYYSVRNGGDGSAYPTFMESEALTEWDQDNMDEGWGECCNGSITLYSDSPITTDEDVKTSLGYLIDMFDNDEKERKIKEFVKEFFPNGTPKMDVEVEELKNETKYVYNVIKVDGKEVGKVFSNIEDSGKKFEEVINKYTVKTLPDNTSMTTQSLSAEEVKSKILNSKGQFVKVKWQSNPKPAGAFKAFNLTKITEGVVRAGIDYANLSSVKEGIESGERGEVQPLPWGEWKSFPYIITHKDAEYIRLYPSIHKPKSLFYVNGELTDKEEFAKYLTPSEAKKLLNPTDDDTPLCFTIKSDNILEIPQEVSE